MFCFYYNRPALSPNGSGVFPRFLTCKRGGNISTRLFHVAGSATATTLVWISAVCSRHVSLRSNNLGRASWSVPAYTLHLSARSCLPFLSVFLPLVRHCHDHDQVSKCIKVLNKHGGATGEQLRATLRYSTMHYNSDTTPKNIRDALAR